MAEVEQGNAKETLLGVLNYIDSPFKLVVVLLLAFLGFSGFFVYQNQDVMIGAYIKNKERPVMNVDKFEPAARLILKATQADVVVIFSVDTILNKRIVERAYIADGSRYKEFDNHDVGLFTKNINNNNDVIRLMANEIPCGEYAKAQSEIGLWYKSLGVNYTCRVSVPPDQNQFIGQITVGWKEKPADPENILPIAALMLSRKQ
jgi:hypothetical protein